MKKINLFLLTILLASVVAIAYVGCKKDDGSSGENTSTTTLTIKVMDKQSSPLGNVSVTCYNQIGTTSGDGLLTLSGISVPASDQERIIISLEKEGYFKAFVGTKPNLASETYFEAVLTEGEMVGTINNNSGGNVSNNSGTIYMNFPPNSLAYPDGTPYSGNANIYTAYYSPDEDNFALSMPGGPDLASINSNGVEGSMISFGALSVETKTPDMKSLQLTGLKSSSVLVNSQIANTMLTEAPATIPIWRLNEETAIWEEIGTGVKQGNRYEYEVDHFSAINCDDFFSFDGALTLIEGDVCDDSLNPLPFARVDVDQRVAFANDKGHFSLYLPSERVYTFESEYCTKTAGSFVVGENNYVDLCCEGGETQGYFKISVDGIYQGQVMNDEFELTFGYFLSDTVIQGNTYNSLVLAAGGADQYWNLIFTFVDLNSGIGTFNGTGTYSLAYPGYDAFFMGFFFPNLDPDEYEGFGCNSGFINITEYVEGDRLAGNFSMVCTLDQDDCNIDGEFEMYEELGLKSQEMIKNKHIGLKTFMETRHK